MNILVLLFVCFSFWNNNSTSSFSQYLSSQGKELHYHGTILDYQNGDSLRIQYDDEGIRSGLSEHSLITLWVDPDSMGKFKFDLPSYGHLSRMVMLFKRHIHGVGLIYDGIVEPGDDININITMNEQYDVSALYSGPGSAKYQCQGQIPSIWTYSAQVLPYRRIYSSRNWLDSFYNRVNKFELDNLAILNNFKSKISPIVYKLLYEEVKANFRNLFVSDIEDLLCSDTVGIQGSALTPGFRKELIANYKNKFMLGVDTSNSLILQRSWAWRSYVINKIQTDYYVKFGRKPTLKKVFEKIAQEYKGVLFDRLIGQLMFYPFSISWGLTSSSEQFQYCMEEGFKLTKSPYIKKAFLAKAVLAKGKEAYDFSYIDTSGNNVELSSFKGKVVMVDCWFTGCTGCAMFYERFKDSLAPAFKGNKDFKVISINLDENKKTWINSLYKDIYTNPSDINLFANAKGFKTGLLDYYKIDGAPFTLLIDKNGKILLSGLGGFPDTNTDVKKIIQSALQQ